MYIYSIKISVPNEPTKWYVGASTKSEHREYWGSGHHIKTHIATHGTKYLKKFILERGHTSIATLSNAEEHAIGRFKRLYGPNCLNDTQCGIIGSYSNIHIAYQVTPTIELPTLHGTVMTYPEFLDCVKELNYSTHYDQCMRCVTKYGIPAIEATYNKIDTFELPTQCGIPITYKQFRDRLRDSNCDGHGYCMGLFNKYRVEPTQPKRTHKKKDNNTTAKQRYKKKVHLTAIYNSIPKHELPTGYNGPIQYATFCNNIRNEKCKYHAQCIELLEKYKQSN